MISRCCLSTASSFSPSGQLTLKNAGKQSVLLTSHASGTRQYLFDEVLDESASQAEATAACCAPVSLLLTCTAKAPSGARPSGICRARIRHDTLQDQWLTMDLTFHNGGEHQAVDSVLKGRNGLIMVRFAPLLSCWATDSGPAAPERVYTYMYVCV